MYEFYTHPFYLNDVNYAIINCKHYLDFKNKKIKFNIIEKYSKMYKKVILEPEVLILKKQNYYRFEKWLNIKDFLSILPNNVYFTLDYPNDMNLLYSELFIKKSYYNACKYSFSKNYMITIQFKFLNYSNFQYWFKKYMEIKSNSLMLGIGNLCRLFYKNKEYLEFFKNIFSFIKNYHIPNNYNQIHIFGLSLRYTDIFFKTLKDTRFILSFDSTKWTRACSNELKNKYGIYCKKETRQEFFNEYLKKINQKFFAMPDINLKF